MNINLSVASGNYRQNNEKLIIETEINGFNGIMRSFYAFAVMFYAIFIVSFFMADTIQGNAAGIVFPLIIMHAAFMFGTPYFITIRGAKKMKHELEREFYYITKK